MSVFSIFQKLSSKSLKKYAFNKSLYAKVHLTVANTYNLYIMWFTGPAELFTIQRILNIRFEAWHRTHIFIALIHHSSLSNAMFQHIKWLAALSFSSFHTYIQNQHKIKNENIFREKKRNTNIYTVPLHYISSSSL